MICPAVAVKAFQRARPPMNPHPQSVWVNLYRSLRTQSHRVVREHPIVSPNRNAEKRGSFPSCIFCRESCIIKVKYSQSQKKVSGGGFDEKYIGYHRGIFKTDSGTE